MKYFTNWRFIGLLFYFGFLFSTSTAYPCNSYTWMTLPSATVLNGSQVNSTNLVDCQTQCIVNANCIGVSWTNGTANGTVPRRCLLNVASENGPKSGINYYNATVSVVYYGLIRNFSNCDAYNCTYEWNGVKDYHGFYATQNNASNLYNCIRSCQFDADCRGLDWNYDESTCWVHKVDYTTLDQPSIYYFPKNCTGGSTPTTKPTSRGPTLPTSSTTSSSSLSSSSTTTTTSTSASTSTNNAASKPPPTGPSTCKDFRCPYMKMCTMGADQVPTCVCNTNCPTEYRIVCGSNGRNYDNLCFLNLDSCETGVKIEYVSQGECPQAMLMANEEQYPLAIRPAYVVLVGVGGGCILLVIMAVVLLCTYPLRGTDRYANSTMSSIQTKSRMGKTSNGDGGGGSGVGGYVESTDNIDMNEVEVVDYNAEDNPTTYNEDSYQD